MQRIPSIILTKVNTFSPRNFGHECELRQTKVEYSNLKDFCLAVHGKKADFVFLSNLPNYPMAVVRTATGKTYNYSGFATCIMRTDDNGKKKFYKIS